MRKIAIIIMVLWALLAGGVWAAEERLKIAAPKGRLESMLEFQVPSASILAEIKKEPVVFMIMCAGMEEFFRFDEDTIKNRMTKQETRDLLLVFNLGFAAQRGEIACPLAKKLLPRFLKKGDKKK